MPSQAPAGGAPVNGGPAAAGTAATSDASATLAELERKLHDLERDLTAIGSAARQPPATAPPATAPPAAAPPRTAPPATAPPRTAPSATAPPRTAPPFAAPPAGESHPAPVNTELGADARLELLLSFRDQLEHSARGLVAEYDRLLAHLPAPALPPAAGGELAGERQGAVSAAAGHPPTGTPRSPAAVGEPEHAPAPSVPAADAAEPSFECRVELDAGPFADVEALSAFERALAGLPHALGARVRRFDGARAAIDLRLALTPALVQEMHEALAVGFSVVDSGPGHLAIVLDRQ